MVVKIGIVVVIDDAVSLQKKKYPKVSSLQQYAETPDLVWE